MVERARLLKDARQACASSDRPVVNSPQVLNEDLHKTFHRWYLGMQKRSGESEQRKAA
jgi:hypothetical protein